MRILLQNEVTTPFVIKTHFVIKLQNAFEFCYKMRSGVTTPFVIKTHFVITLQNAFEFCYKMRLGVTPFVIKTRL